MIQVDNQRIAKIMDALYFLKMFFICVCIWLKKGLTQFIDKICNSSSGIISSKNQKQSL